MNKSNIYVRVKQNIKSMVKHNVNVNEVKHMHTHTDDLPNQERPKSLLPEQYGRWLNQSKGTLHSLA